MRNRKDSPATDFFSSIITERPTWLVRNGLLVFFVLTVLFILASNFIRYHEEVPLPINMNAAYGIYFPKAGDDSTRFFRKLGQVMPATGPHPLNAVDVKDTRENGYRFDVIIQDQKAIVVCRDSIPSFQSTVSTPLADRIHIGDLVTITAAGNGARSTFSGKITAKTPAGNGASFHLAISPAGQTAPFALLLSAAYSNQLTCTLPLSDKMLFSILSDKLSSRGRLPVAK
ncbi:hypothetical protein GWC95_06475 [Sediminibacterium roseum]|uniref:DUF5666 domain-containing protein n=1 Tax=Sediminibacterium roseum TaxID=1978412 RepID=A0ABW9ZR26_9BACT|nr:hypothetical protein [Sediminibacterium roseum]NCI49559.1 hypothetical protein [Sediminibacterium roseum]